MNDSDALIMAVVERDIVRCRRLIAAGADRRDDNMYDLTPIHWAAQEGNIEAIRTLADSGADLNIQDDLGHTAIMAVCEDEDEVCDIEVVRTLAEKGADVNVKVYLCLINRRLGGEGRSS